MLFVGIEKEWLIRKIVIHEILLKLMRF